MKIKIQNIFNEFENEKNRAEKNLKNRKIDEEEYEKIILNIDIKIEE